jgi:hypothetical protein
MNFVGPFPVADAMERLRAQVPDLKFISGAADLATAIAQQPPAVPAAYVLSEDTSREAHGYTDDTLAQDSRAVVQVVLFVRNYSRENTGAAAERDMTALATKVRLALLNWSPVPGEILSLQSLAGRNESFKGANLCRQEIFRSGYTIEVSA